METITQFNVETGELEAVISADEPILRVTKKHIPWVEGEWDSDTYYVVDGTPTPRPENPTTLTDLTLENVPVPATVTINGTTYETESDSIDLEFDQIGAYKITVEAFPYLDKDFEIEVTEVPE